MERRLVPLELIGHWEHWGLFRVAADWNGAAS